MTDLAALLQSYGYPLLAIGCLIEGETILALAGFAAHQGHLDFLTVVAIAALAGFAGDQGFFWLGRRRGAALLARFPKIARQRARIEPLIDRWHGGLIVMLRFTYGLRIAGPVVLGASGLAPWRFALFNAIGAALWAPLVAGAGWLFGHAMEALLGDIRRFELWAFALLALAAGALLLWRRHARRR